MTLPSCLAKKSVTKSRLKCEDALLHVDAAKWPSTIPYWPLYPVEWIHGEPQHRNPRKQWASPWFLADFNGVFLRFRRHLPNCWRLETYLSSCVLSPEKVRLMNVASSTSISTLRLLFVVFFAKKIQVRYDSYPKIMLSIVMKQQQLSKSHGNEGWI